MSELLHYDKHGNASNDIILIHGWASSRLMWASILDGIDLPESLGEVLDFDADRNVFHRLRLLQ